MGSFLTFVNGAFREWINHNPGKFYVPNVPFSKSIDIAKNTYVHGVDLTWYNSETKIWEKINRRILPNVSFCKRKLEQYSRNWNVFQSALARLICTVRFKRTRTSLDVCQVPVGLLERKSSLENTRNPESNDNTQWSSGQCLQVWKALNLFHSLWIFMGNQTDYKYKRLLVSSIRFEK